MSRASPAPCTGPAAPGTGAGDASLPGTGPASQTGFGGLGNFDLLGGATEGNVPGAGGRGEAAPGSTFLSNPLVTAGLGAGVGFLVGGPLGALVGGGIGFFAPAYLAPAAAPVASNEAA